MRSVHSSLPPSSDQLRSGELHRNEGGAQCCCIWDFFRKYDLGRLFIALGPTLLSGKIATGILECAGWVGWNAVLYLTFSSLAEFHRELSALICTPSPSIDSIGLQFQTLF